MQIHYKSCCWSGKIHKESIFDFVPLKMWVKKCFLFVFLCRLIGFLHISHRCWKDGVKRIDNEDWIRSFLRRLYRLNGAIFRRMMDGANIKIWSCWSIKRDCYNWMEMTDSSIKSYLMDTIDSKDANCWKITRFQERLIEKGN